MNSLFQALINLQQISDGSLDDVEFPKISHKVEQDENEDFDLPENYVEVDTAKDSENIKKNKMKNNCICSICNKCFRDSWKLKRHIKVHIKAGDLPAGADVFIKKEAKPVKERRILSENNSIKQKRTKKDFICSECNRPFKTGQKLRRHEQVHINARELIQESNHPNEEKPKLFKGMKVLDENLGEAYEIYLKDFFKYECAIIRENGKVGLKYSCLLCLPVKKVLLTYKNPVRHLGSHIKSIHPKILAKYDEITKSLITSSEPNLPTKAPFTCPDCQQEFESYVNLKNHWQETHKIIVKNESSSLCNLCGKTFQQKHKYTFHLWREHGIGEQQEHECDICGKKFAGYKSQALAQHKLIHKGTKDHVCHICGAGFKSSILLKYHTQQVHEHSGKFECMYCDYKTPVGYRLDVHVNAVHTKTIKYSCEECNFSCYTKGNLTAHRKTVHLKLKPHKCPICPEAYIRKSELEKHMSATGHSSIPGQNN